MEHLAWAREERGLSQRELSEMSDISRQRISRFECGYEEPTQDELDLMANILEYHAEDLL